MTRKDVILESAKYYLENYILPEIEKTKANSVDYDEEAKKAKKLLDNWIEGNDPTIRNALRAYVDGMDARKTENFNRRAVLDDKRGMLESILDGHLDLEGEDDVVVYDGTNDPTFSKPSKIRLLDEETDVTNWLAAMTFVVRTAGQHNPDKVAELAGKRLYALRDAPEEGRNYKDVELGDGRHVWVSGGSAKNTVDYMHRILKECGIDDRQLTIVYKERKQQEAETETESEEE